MTFWKWQNYEDIKTSAVAEGGEGEGDKLSTEAFEGQSTLYDSRMMDTCCGIFTTTEWTVPSVNSEGKLWWL